MRRIAEEAGYDLEDNRMASCSVSSGSSILAIDIRMFNVVMARVEDGLDEDKRHDLRQHFALANR